MIVSFQQRSQLILLLRKLCIRNLKPVQQVRPGKVEQKV